MNALQTLILDAKAQLKRAKGTKYLEAQPELANNVWPTFLAFMETVRDEIGEVNATVDDMLEAEGSVIQLDLADALFENFELGKAVAAGLRKLVPTLDDITAKPLVAALEAWEKSTGIVEIGVQEATVDEDGDVEPDGDGEKEETDVEGGDDEADEADEADDTAPGVAAKDVR
jgi:hypothetical protein